MAPLNACGIEFSSFSKNLRNLESYVTFSFIVFDISFFNFNLKGHLIVLILIEFNAIAVKGSYRHIGCRPFFNEITLGV